jgi:hypothetical protein
VEILIQYGPELGLHLSPLKSTVWCPAHHQDDADPLDRGIPRVGQEGVKLLGALIGSHAFQKVAMEEKVYKLEKLMDKLSLLEDPHTEYAMLKSCFALPKLSFLMRTVDPRQHQGDSGQV